MPPDCRKPHLKFKIFRGSMPPDPSSIACLRHVSPKFRPPPLINIFLRLWISLYKLIRYTRIKALNGISPTCIYSRDLAISFRTCNARFARSATWPPAIGDATHISDGACEEVCHPRPCSTLNVTASPSLEQFRKILNLRQRQCVKQFVDFITLSRF